MIELREISKIFPSSSGEGFKALDEVSLEVPKGQIFGIVGASGAGKSTLVRCVNLLEAPTNGSILIDGEDITQLKPRSLMKARRSIGMIFQHFNLLSRRTVYGNIALPLELQGMKKSLIKEKVHYLLEMVGLADKVDSYPINLSGGQKQRVAIARALTGDPKVLLCDEATSALDPATTQSILKLLKEINQRLNLTILLITHEMDVVKAICDQVAIIDSGQLIEVGAVSEVFSNPKTALARKFIKSTFQVELPEEYQEKMSATPKSTHYSPIVRFDFTGNTVDAPVLSLASKKYDIDFSILLSQIDYAGGIKFGYVIAEVTGEKERIEETYRYFKNNHIEVEVLGYV